jgi:uncharacterized protein YpuA (DUF1002 family)
MYRVWVVINEKKKYWIKSADFFQISGTLDENSDDIKTYLTKEEAEEALMQVRIDLGEASTDLGILEIP